jgi:hypothetical protein
MNAYGIWIYPSEVEPTLQFDSKEEAEEYALENLKGTGTAYTIDEVISHCHCGEECSEETLEINGGVCPDCR